MPAKSEKQRKYIFALRNKYGSKSNTPEKDKWVWESEWEKVEEYKPYKSLFRKENLLQKFKEQILSAVTEIDTSKPTDQQILRISISAELSAVNLYQALAELTSNVALKKVLLDVTKEEKTHVAEFETLLNVIDKEQSQENINGQREVKDLINV